MLVILVVMNRKGVTRTAPYILCGIVLWISVLKSGVHATLAGVILAFFIPMRARNDEGKSPLLELEQNLHPTVAYGVLPVFAFANAGVPLEGISLASLLEPVPLGIAAGLFFGKQIGIFLFSWVAIASGFAKLPERAGWKALYGVSILGGVGLTMSLFIGSLAFELGGPDYEIDDRLGVLLGSLLSGVVGFLVLRSALGKESPAPSG